jgi:trans-aconitate methyltransferase
MSGTVWDPRQYNDVADFVAKLGEPLITLLQPKISDHILDLGCGDGSLSVKLKPLCARLIGVDASQQMIESAKAKGIEAFVKDAHELSYQQEFDAVFSNAALHWMLKPETIIENIHTALKPKGVFVAEFGGLGNAKLIVNALTQELNQAHVAFDNPWYFPSEQEYSALLTQHGFKIDYIDLFDRLTPLKGHVQDWVCAFAQMFLKNATGDERQAILNNLSASIQSDLFIDKVWHVDYVRLRLKATKC